MPKVRWGLLALLGAALLPSARASVVFTLTSSGCGGCPPGPFGTITITQLTTDSVGVVEQLAPNVFANTGAGAALGYNLDTTATVSNLTPAGVFTTGGSENFPPLGTFTSTIVCSGCGNGTSPPQYNSLSFTLTSSGALSAADFTANSLGFFFASDIGVVSNGNVIWTGNVGAGPSGGGGGGGGGGPTPEPSTYLLLGTGLLGLSLLKRKLA